MLMYLILNLSFQKKTALAWQPVSKYWPDPTGLYSGILFAIIHMHFGNPLMSKLT